MRSTIEKRPPLTRAASSHVPNSAQREGNLHLLRDLCHCEFSRTATAEIDLFSLKSAKIPSQIHAQYQWLTAE